MSKLEVDKLDPQSGTALEIGTSGDTITVPSGVGLTLTNSTLLLPTTVTATTEVKTNKISPATGVAFALGDSGDTFTVPAGATITNSGTATGFGGGKIGQVLSVTKTDVFGSTTTSWHDIPDLTLDITPAATSSRIYWIFSVSGSSDDFAYVKPTYGDNSELNTQAIGDAASNRTRATAASLGSHVLSDGVSNSVMGVDSPNTASSVTYKMRLWTSGPQFYINRMVTDTDNANYGRGISTFTIMEILA